MLLKGKKEVLKMQIVISYLFITCRGHSSPLKIKVKILRGITVYKFPSSLVFTKQPNFNRKYHLKENT
jgi:hypothetical protein